jgi:hypothetical protein
MGALAINTSNVIRSSQGSIFIGTAGQTITAGQPLYFDTVTSTYKLANAVGASPQYIVAGVAVDGASTNQDIVVCSRDANFSPGHVINSGNIAILGNVAGQVNDIADRATGWFVTVLGVGLGGNRTNFQLAGANAAM